MFCDHRHGRRARPRLSSGAVTGECPLLIRANPGRPGDAEPRGPARARGQPSRQELSILGGLTMTKRSKPFLFLIAAGLTVATVACGGGSSSVSGPDTPAAAIPPAAGATIAGTVQSGGAASGDVGASSVSGLRVSVSGTALQTTTDGSGRFTLSGVPSGHVELHFEGSGVDARLGIDGLQSGQTLNVTVRVSGSSASKVDDDGEVEVKGKVDSVASSSITVAGK